MAENTVHNVKTFFKEILFIFEFFRHSRGFYLCQSGGLNQNFLHILFCGVIKEIWQHAKYMFLLKELPNLKTQQHRIVFVRIQGHQPF